MRYASRESGFIFIHEAPLMTDVRTSSVTITRLTKLAASCLLAVAGFLGTSHYAHALTLTSASVTPGSTVVSASSTVTAAFTTASALPTNAKIVITFPTGFNISAITPPINCTGFTQGFSFGVSSQVLTLTLDGTGSTTGAPAAISCTFPTIVNPNISGTTGTYTLATTQNNGTAIDSATVAGTTITAADPNASVVKATPTSGSTGNLTLTTDIVRALVVTDKINITFPASYAVAQTVASIAAGSISCSSGSATLSITASGQVLTLTVATSGTLAASSGCTIVIPGADAIPQYVDTTNISTYTIQNTSSVDISSDSTVALTDSTVGALSSTNVIPGSSTVGVTNTVTVNFTNTTSIPSTGKIKVTFGSGYVVTSVASTSATCSTMDGSFAAAFSGQVVTITRSTGSPAVAGAQTCTIALIRNPVTAGTTGTYTILTTTSADASIDTDTAVAADTMFSASGSSNAQATSTPLTYDIAFSAPAAAAAYSADDSIVITWSTAGGTGTVAAVNLDYSTDGGSTFTSIVTATANDGSYTWTAPDISAQSVTIRGQATDLLTVLDTATSNAFSIGTEATTTEDTSTTTTTTTTTDTSSTSTTLLPTGTFMKGTSWTTVYYVEGTTRRPFLDSQTFFTYADNFDSIIETSDDYLANYTIGAPMVAKAGSVLVKIQSVDKVYALTDDSTLRWITSESLASSLYGSNWADYVIDVPVTAWGHFTIGDDITSVNDITVDRSMMETRTALNSK